MSEAITPFALAIAEETLADLRARLAFIITPACTVLAVFATRRWFSGSEGSSIPQVIAALERYPAGPPPPTFLPLYRDQFMPIDIGSTGLDNALRTMVFYQFFAQIFLKPRIAMLFRPI